MGGAQATPGTQSSRRLPALSCALLEDETVECWGWKREGLLEEATGHDEEEEGPFYIALDFEQAF